MSKYFLEDFVFKHMVFVFLPQSMFHVRTKRMSGLLFCISWSSVLWKVDRLITVFELNNDKRFQTLFFYLFLHESHPYLLVLFLDT